MATSAASSSTLRPVPMMDLSDRWKAFTISVDRTEVRGISSTAMPRAHIAATHTSQAALQIYHDIEVINRQRCAAPLRRTTAACVNLAITARDTWDTETRGG